MSMNQVWPGREDQVGYHHIDNLYKAQEILMFRRCWALEKVHGTSAHVLWQDGRLSFFAGGADHETFVGLFDQDQLRDAFQAMGHPRIGVYGEAYGSRDLGMARTYGPDLRFATFDIQVGDVWLAVPNMVDVAGKLGLEVVPCQETSTDLEALDALRDAPSEVAARLGTGVWPREGIVLRPLIELRKNNGDRIMAKHKAHRYSERKTEQAVTDLDRLAVLSDATAIADEWVTDMRLTHVLGRLPAVTIRDMELVVTAMVEDVYREAVGEIVPSKAVRSAIGRKTVELFRARYGAQKGNTDAR